MATTFTGTLSMLSDKLFKFKLETDQAGFFDFVKNALAVINKMIEANEATLVSFAQKSSAMLINVIKSTMLGGAVLIDLFRPVFIYIAGALKGTFEILKALPPGVRELGIIGFLMLGTAGKLLVLAIGSTIDTLRSMLGDLANAYAFVLEKSVRALHKIGLASDEVLERNLAVVNEFRDAAEKLKTPLADINKQIDESGQYTQDWMILTKKLNEFFEKVNANIVISQKQFKELLGRIDGADEATKSWSISMTAVAETIQESIKKNLEAINHTIARTILQGIKSWSKGMAEVLVLGKDIGDTMRAIAEKIMVSIVAKAIELVALWALEKAMKQAGLIIEQKLTHEYQKQLTLKTAMAAVSMFSGGIPFFQHGGAVSKGKPIVVGERGPEMFVPNTSGQITQNARGTGGSPVNVNFSITTLDASGFSEMLVQNRGTISNIINQAVNERGASNIV
jgi:hypothetical protein